ncbi:MAG: peptidoglycan-binding protein [Vulcanimicrobiota bacterium]
MPIVSKVSINHVPCLKIEPQDTETIAPILHMGKASEAPQDFGKLTALINGTFFTDLHTVFPQIYGDILTPVENAYGFPQSASQHLDLRGKRYFWSQATYVNKTGYENRCGLGMRGGSASLARHQYLSQAEISEFDWFLGGGALLVVNGALANFGAAGPLGLHTPAGGAFDSGVTRDAPRSACGITPAGKIHFIVAREDISVNSLAHGLLSLGYQHAVMFDGGGATAAGWKVNGRVQFPAGLRHGGYDRLSNLLAVFETRELAFQPIHPVISINTMAFALTAAPSLPAWPDFAPDEVDVRVKTLQHLLNYHAGTSTRPGGRFDAATQQRLADFQAHRQLPATGKSDSATWEALVQTVQRGDKNQAVSALQVSLHYWHSLDLGVSGPGRDGVDGNFGGKTEVALTVLRRRLGLEQTAVDETTWRYSLGPSTLAPFQRTALAQAILANSAISLASQHPSGVTDHAFARLNMQDTAAGGEAQRSSYQGAPGGTVALSLRMLTAMLSLAVDYGFQFHVSEIAGGSHSPNSWHYEGTTMDVSIINGVHVGEPGDVSVAFRAAGRTLGATEILGPGDAGHADHVHLAWNS